MGHPIKVYQSNKANEQTVLANDSKRKEFWEVEDNFEWTPYLWAIMVYMILLLWGMNKKKRIDKKRK